MNLIIKVLVTCCLLQASVFAETSKKIEYVDQKVEAFNLENFLKEITMIDQEVKGTCERKIPYQENVCRDVTKYKKECAIVPAHEECRQVNNPICHTETTWEEECRPGPSTQECRDVTESQCSTQTTYETECHDTPSREQCRTVPGEQECRVVVNYRQECHTEGGGQECRTIPGDVQCSIVNGENRCVKIPPRQECSSAPSRQVCNQVPYEERECRQGPSRQECDTIPGRQECRQVPRQEQVCRDVTRQQCRSVPGDEICRDVPRKHEVCEDNYSTVCEDVPAREVCKQVPYQEQVCKMETKYKTEEYECMKVIKVPQEKLIKTHKANVKVEFAVLSEILGPEFSFDLDEKGKLVVTATANNEEYYKDSKAVVFVKKDVKNKDEGAINNIDANVKVTMLDSNTNLAYMKTSDIYASLKKHSLTFHVIGKVDPKRTVLGLKIMRKEIVEIDKLSINKGNITYKFDPQTNYTAITVDLKSEGAKIGSIFSSEKTQFDTTITFTQNFSDAGDLILGRVNNTTLKLNRILQLTK